MKRSTTFRMEANSNNPTTSAARTVNVHRSLWWSRFDTACPSRRDIDTIAVTRQVACPGGEPGDRKREEAAGGARQGTCHGDAYRVDVAAALRRFTNSGASLMQVPKIAKDCSSARMP